MIDIEMMLLKLGASITIDKDPVIGRDDETRRIIQVLARRTKNNPVLIHYSIL